MQSIVSFVQLPAARYLLTQEVPPREAERPNMASAFVAQDGKPLVFHLSSPPKFWEGLTEAIGRPELKEDPRFQRRADRIKNYDALHQICQDVFATAPRQHWINELEGMMCRVAPSTTSRRSLRIRRSSHHGMTIEVHHPEMGRVRLSANPVNLRGTAIRYETAPPLLGEHTDEILVRCGYDAERIKELAEAGIV